MEGTLLLEVDITDSRTAFTSRLTQEVTRLSSTPHRETTVYHPQTNGPTERITRPSPACYRCTYIDVKHKTLDTILPCVIFAYNWPVQETTIFTPFLLDDGLEAMTTLHAM